MQKVQTITNPQTDWEGWIAYLASAINVLAEENETRLSASEAENAQLREELAGVKKKLGEMMGQVFQRTPPARTQPAPSPATKPQLQPEPHPALVPALPDFLQ